MVGNSNAFKVAQQQRPVTYKATFDAAEARRRLAHYFIPYHRAVSQQIARLRRTGVPAIVSIHSFTPILQPQYAAFSSSRAKGVSGPASIQSGEMPILGRRGGWP